MTESTMPALNEKSAISVFVDNKIDSVLSDIEKEILSVVPDTSTKKGRDEIASNAYRASRSKKRLEEAANKLTEEWKAKTKLVNDDKKRVVNFLDDLRDKARKPLTDYEAAEKIKAEQERIAKELEQAFEDATKENQLFDREKAIAEKERLALEAEQERLKLEEEKQAEVKRVEEEKRLKTEKLERELKLKETAAAEATKQAELEAQKKIDEANELRLAEEKRARQAEVDRLFAIEKAKQDAEKAERERLEALEQAKKDKQAAIEDEYQKGLAEAERVEQERIKNEAEAARVAKVKSDNKAHQRAVNNKALKCFEKNGIDSELAKKLVIMIAEKNIDGITINY